jgi:methylase of polypeptide subunit release factors
MTRFNALLNGVDGIDVRHGSFFEPVAGERFGLIVANPPFVISPDRSFSYRDGGLEGDGVVQLLAERAGELLEEGGFFEMICDWAEVEGQSWMERMAGWFAGTGCDVQVLRFSHMPVEAYAARWIGHTESGGARERIAVLERWLEAYRQLGIEAVSTGIVAARRRTADRNWFRPGPAPPKMSGPAGEAIARRFELRDRLQSLGGREGFLALRPRRADAARLDQEMAPTDGGWALERAHLHLVTGLAERQQIDPITASFLSRCDGARTVHDLAVDMATAVDRPVAELLADLGPVLESMLELGFLELD